MKKKFFWIGLVLTLSLAALAIGAFRSQASRSAAAGLDLAKKEAKELGLPTSMDEVPEGQDPTANAAPLVERALERLDTTPSAAADLMFEASRMTSLVFDWERVSQPGFWSGIQFLELIGALMDSAEQALSAGQIRDFRLRLQGAIHLSRLAATVPTDEAYRTAIDAERLCYGRMAKLMVDNSASETLMVEVQAAVFEKWSVKSLLTAIRKFVATGNEVAQNREIDGDQKLSWLWTEGAFPTDPWGRNAVEATHLRGSIDLAKKIGEAANWNNVIASFAELTQEWENQPDPLYSTLKESAPTIKDLPRLAAENEAARRILFVAAGAFRAKHAKGAFPVQSPIRGEMEYDPFNDEPLKYSNPGTGFYVYSVGPDKLDSSGSSEEGLTFGLDIGFKYRGFDSAEGQADQTPR